MITPSLSRPCALHHCGNAACVFQTRHPARHSSPLPPPLTPCIDAVYAAAVCVVQQRIGLRPRLRRRDVVRPSVSAFIFVFIRHNCLYYSTVIVRRLLSSSGSVSFVGWFRVSGNGVRDVAPLKTRLSKPSPSSVFRGAQTTVVDFVLPCGRIRPRQCVWTTRW